MASGPGKYDEACTIVRAMTGGDTVLVLVVDGGTAGPGFSVQTNDPEWIRRLPDILRTLAAAIARDADRLPEKN